MKVHIKMYMCHSKAWKIFFYSKMCKVPCTATVAILEDSINLKLRVVTVVHMAAVMLRDTIRYTMCDMSMNSMLQVICTS